MLAGVAGAGVDTPTARELADAVVAAVAAHELVEDRLALLNLL